MQWQSIVVAYSIGVLLTFVVVGISAWRVSRLNIVTAVRNLPDPPPQKRRKRRWIGGLVAMALGALLIFAGVDTAEAMQFILGIALFAIGAVPVVQALGVPQRIAYTVAGLVVVVVCLLPFNWLDTLARDGSADELLGLDRVGDPDRARCLVGDRLQRRPPARRS